MNAARKKLMNSWKRDGVGYVGSDGVRAYRVDRLSAGDGERFPRHWRVLVEGEPLRSRSHRAERTFSVPERACWAAEVHAERLDAAGQEPEGFKSALDSLNVFNESMREHFAVSGGKGAKR